MLKKILHYPATAWIILCLSLIVTYVGLKVSSGYAAKRAEERFSFAANEAETLIRKRMLEYEQVLRGSVGLLEASDSVSRAEWRRYVESIRVQKFFPGIQGIGFTRVLTPAALPDFETRIRSEGFPDFQVTPVGDRALYTSVEFLEPFDPRNQRAFGYDMYSHPVRRAAMARARDTGDAAMSAKVILLQETETDVQPGVLTFLPLYRRDVPLKTVDDRRDALIGFVYAPFRLRDLMMGMLDHTRREVDVRVYDGDVVSSAGFLHDTAATALVDPENLPPATYREQRRITLSGQPWILEFASNAQFDAATATQQPTLVALSGVVIDSLLFIIIATLGSHYRQQKHATLDTRNKLRDYVILQEAILNSAGSAIIATDVDGIISVFNPAAERMLGYCAADLMGLHTPATFHLPDEVKDRAALFSTELGYPIEPGFRVFVAKADLDLPNLYEWTYVRKDSTHLTVLLNVTAIHDAHGGISGYLGIANDITDRKTTEKHLADTLQSITSLNRALNHHAIVAVTDIQGTIIEVNDKFSEISGYRRDELIGKNHRILNSHAQGPNFFAEMWRTIAHGSVWRGQIRNRAKDGTHYWVDTTIVPVLDENHKPKRYIAVRTDITAQRRNLELLNESQHLAQVGGWEFIVHSGLIHMTAEAYHIHRLKPGDEINLETKLSLYEPADARNLRSHIQQTIATGEAFDLELESAQRGTALSHWLRITGRADMTDHGAYRITGSVQDIDEVKRAQIALAASEQRFRTLAATLPVGIWEVDSAGECLYTNRAWQETAGLTLPESLGLGFTQSVHPEDRDSTFAAWNAAVSQNKTFEHDFRFQTNDGRIRWVHSIGTAIKRDGVVIGYVGGNLDITERRAATADLAASEQRFRTLAATLPVGIYETDDAGQCTFTNAAWQRMANLTAAESNGNGWAATIHPEDRQNVFDAWNQAMVQGITFDHEFRFKHPDGTECWVHSIASALTQNGTITGYVGVNEDITDRLRSIEILSASLAEKEVLLREVHHRVKNNLQLVTSLLSLQASYISDPIALELFQESQRRVRTMALVHEMLYSHTSLARIQIDVYLRQLAQTIVRSFSREKERTRVDLEIAPLALVPDITIPLGLIVNELITNSCKHAVVAGQNLVLSLQIKKIAAHQAELTFTDNGPGVPPDFDPIKAKSLGHRLIGLLSRQLRAELDPPTPGGPATYVIRFKFENLPNRPETASLRPSTKLP